jgi:hypothetical protein
MPFIRIIKMYPQALLMLAPPNSVFGIFFLQGLLTLKAAILSCGLQIYGESIKPYSLFEQSFIEFFSRRGAENDSRFQSISFELLFRIPPLRYNCLAFHPEKQMDARVRFSV